MRVCPVCGTETAVLELHGTEIDYCFSCGGIWLDSGELEALIGDETKSLEILQSFKDVSPTNKEKKHPCPVCGKAMKKVEVTFADNPIILDKCPKEHGIWFDKDELFRIVNSANVTGNDKVVEFLKDLFPEENN